MVAVFFILFWFSVFLGTGALLFCSVYTLLLFADLDADHINPFDLCDYINRLVIPEYAGHLFLTLLVLLRGFYVAALLNIPLLVFHTRRYLDRRHLVHSTTVFNEKDKCRHIAQIKLVHHLVMFFVFLYYFIVTLIASES